ncbi:hypothetical protein EJ05DRAFT_113643 [Pseudovirgaria hyperparasitica]|uniref:Uncharacterized protein n=1 Tax=Pseudovirgaria hyperparasitica TaxID=470096 RepID=A0A6A6VZM0_9PEZI|nr:uncharacterized protein EJ05DRAFT_113643 [Pseudovirgaria hyperparasitica]KAF2755733.1 hypothetical protein EJ05DRAFT_113643 [Pseudovirgaria hyperparasitica]
MPGRLVHEEMMLTPTPEIGIVKRVYTDQPAYGLVCPCPCRSTCRFTLVLSRDSPLPGPVHVPTSRRAPRWIDPLALATTSDRFQCSPTINMLIKLAWDTPTLDAKLPIAFSSPVTPTRDMANCQPLRLVAVVRP